MTSLEIIREIDDGAINYLRFFGDAEHMRTLDNGVYTIVEPKESEEGIRFVYDIRLENLSDAEARARIREIRALKLAIWWPLRPLCSPRIARLIARGEGASESSEHYMAVLPEDFVGKAQAGVALRRADDAEAFKRWALLGNRVFADGHQDVHPVKHFPWVKDGRLIPYVAYIGGEPAGIAAILRHHDAASLEFVAVPEAYRRQGVASALSAHAVSDAFAGGAKLVTTRAFPPACLIYQALGFQSYLRG